mgnify:CR=1 FL=1
MTVSYNSSSLLRPMLDSIPPETPVIIVDNGSSDSGDLPVLAKRPRTHVIYNSYNAGFGTACNIGAGKSETEFILFLNPDCRLKTDTIEKLLSAAVKYPELVAANPVFEDRKGKLTFKRKSSLIPKKQWMQKSLPGTDFSVPVLLGAAFFVRAEKFHKIGGFDENIFLFFEDDDLSLRLSNSPGALKVIHKAIVKHEGGASSNFSLESEKIKNLNWGYSWVYTRKKHSRPLASLLPAFRTLLMLLSPLVLISQRRRLKYHFRLRGVLNAFKT